MNVANSYKVQLIPYDIRWPNLFEDEAKRIQKVLGTSLAAIYHIGSTSIPHMPAKPVIDMMLVIDNLDETGFIREQLSQLNYDPIRRQIIPHVSFVTKRQDETIRFHLHLHERGSPQINRHVNFRDYLIHHPEIARDYAKLKTQLAAQFGYDIYSYVSGKDKLVQEIDAKAKLWPGRKKEYLPPNTGIHAKYWPQEKLLQAIGANFNVYMTHFAQYSAEIELVRVPGFTLVHSGLANSSLNYVLDADFSSENAHQKIAEVTDYFTRKKSPFSWWISPLDQPEDLAAHLEHHGYKNTRNTFAMYLDLDAWDKPSPSQMKLDIVAATDEQTLKDFASVLACDGMAFQICFARIAAILTEDDPLEFYVGYINGTPVACASCCYFAQISGLYLLTTTPAERRKGYAKALQEYCLQRSKELGYHLSVVHTSKESRPYYQHLRYKECGSFNEYQK
ncbi:GNAT family N-acetyltransferase [Legionella shakespearei]|uniref:Glutamate rich protein GrpB n=1 Tax=Legionella shakespearei DSM 23087 TaxID=1122169 RepID=A0A0W0YLG4_9GAMM|nr:GNAT family N-acetyltransferase [Legionella shakespearei]KTD57738.1 glutamate rich protein GrpB [Legionella shakespearei DSM 23087]